MKKQIVVFSQKDQARMDLLKKKLRLPDDAAVMKRALSVLEQLVEDEERGAALVCRENNGTEKPVTVLPSATIHVLRPDNQQ